ncbi:MAG TPA: DUF4956 domain-containing protein [Gemmatimonadaceae bacterium]|nr:DUF4956 domain-containing protein [Gemmatimonadaceae bacterium]
MAKYRAQTTSDGDVTEGRANGLSPAARRLLWIVAYYAVAGLVVGVLWRTYPQIRALLEADRLRELAIGDPFTRSDVAAAPGQDAAGALHAGWFTLFALAGSLACALPVAWVYSLTRRRKGFEQSMVHTLILLPLAIAGMVVLIQNSLALAFSLAGIVAVLRFRNTLDDTKDGVYIFIVTGIGISAAVGALVVGALTSIVFNLAVLVLWWIDFARKPTPGIRGGIRRLARLPRVQSGGRAAVPAGAGNSGGWANDPVFASAAEAWRRQLRMTSEHRILDPEGRFNGSLRVHTLDPTASQPVVERLLSERAKRWELVGILPGDGGRFTLKYLVKLRKSDRGEVLSLLRQQGTPHMVGVEFR